MKILIPLFLLCLSLVILPTANAKKLKKFKTKEALCSYLEDKKKQAEERMHRGYSVKQYNKLEANRKYWKNQYIDHCF